MTTGYNDNFLTQTIKTVRAMQFRVEDWVAVYSSSGFDKMKTVELKNFFEQQKTELLLLLFDKWTKEPNIENILSEAERARAGYADKIGKVKEQMIYSWNEYNRPYMKGQIKLYGVFYDILDVLVIRTEEVVSRLKATSLTSLRVGLALTLFLLDQVRENNSNIIYKEAKIMEDAQRAGLTTEDIIQVYRERDEKRRANERAKFMQKLAGDE